MSVYEIPWDCWCAVVLFLDTYKDYMALRAMSHEVREGLDLQSNFYCTEHLRFCFWTLPESEMPFVLRLSLSIQTDRDDIDDIMKFFPNVKILNYTQGAFFVGGRFSETIQDLAICASYARKSPELPIKLRRLAITCTSAMNIPNPLAQLQELEVVTLDIVSLNKNICLGNLTTLTLFRVSFPDEILKALPRKMAKLEMQLREATLVTALYVPIVKTMVIESSGYLGEFFEELTDVQLAELRELKLSYVNTKHWKLFLLKLPRVMVSVSLEECGMLSPEGKVLPLAERLELKGGAWMDDGGSFSDLNLAPNMKSFRFSSRHVGTISTHGLPNGLRVLRLSRTFDLYSKTRICGLPEGMRELRAYSRLTSGTIELPKGLTKFTLVVEGHHMPKIQFPAAVSVFDVKIASSRLGMIEVPEVLSVISQMQILGRLVIRGLWQIPSEWTSAEIELERTKFPGLARSTVHRKLFEWGCRLKIQ